jgi:signal transduction histidine kinase
MNDRFQGFHLATSRWVPNWLRLLFPILLGGILIAMIVHIMYFGGKRESLVAQGESRLIRWALAFAQKPVTATSSKVVTISVSDSDLETLDLAPNKQLRDAHIHEYASVLEQVAATNPEWIVISWLSYAHPFTEEYLAPLTSVIDRLQLHKKVTLAVNFFAVGTISPEFIQAYNIAEARDCYYEVNLFCSYSTDWLWMPQQILNRYFKDQKPWIASTNLPHHLPNILLNLSPSGTFSSYTFLDFQPPVLSTIPNGSVVFIGNDTQQSLHFRDNKDTLQRTYTAVSRSGRTLMKDGIPWHVFWAEMTEMFTTEKTIAVVPEWICIGLTGFMTVAMISAITFWGGGALAPFLASSLGLACVNIFLVSVFKIYLPVIPIIVAGFVVFTAAAFVSVAYSSYTKWRLRAEEHLAESTTDIKQNFIHLISHNLNTPIAQLRGLLEMLGSRNPEDQSIVRASTQLEFVRITVRAVLNTTTMAAQDLRWEEHPMRKFIHEFIENEAGFFRRTGVGISILPGEDDEDHGDVWFFRFNFDHAMVYASLVYASALLSIRCNSSQIVIHFAPVNSEPGDPQGLIVTLTSTASNPNQPLLESEFATAALSGFLEMAVSRGVLIIKEDSGTIVLSFPPQAPSKDGQY